MKKCEYLNSRLVAPLDEGDAVINCCTRVFNDGVTAGKRIGFTECHQGGFLREHFGFFHKCFEVVACLVCPASCQNKHRLTPIAEPDKIVEAERVRLGQSTDKDCRAV